MSSSNIIPQDSPSEKAKVSPSVTEKKELATLSLAHHGDNSGQSKSKKPQGKNQAPPSSTLSPGSTKTEASPLLLIRLTTLLKKWKQRIKIVWIYFRLKLIYYPLIRFRNRRRKILKYPDKRLFIPSKPITDFSEQGIKKLERLVTIMSATLNKQDWGQKLGITAPQIGVNKRVFIALGHVFVNPEFTPTKAPTEAITESCYSVGKDKLYKMQRAKYGWLKYQDLNGKWCEEKISGLKAIVVQHELDHLNGKFCVEKGEKIK